MAKKTVTPRKSAKQALAEYKTRALAFINTLRTPGTMSAFFVDGYSVTGGVKKPNTVSVPELIAITGTARQLGRTVTLYISGSGDNARLHFQYVDAALPTPLDLY